MPPPKSSYNAAKKLWFVWLALAASVVVALIGSSRIGTDLYHIDVNLAGLEDLVTSAVANETSQRTAGHKPTATSVGKDDSAQQGSEPKLPPNEPERGSTTTNSNDDDNDDQRSQKDPKNLEKEQSHVVPVPPGASDSKATDADATTSEDAKTVLSPTNTSATPFNYTAYWENVMKHVNPDLLEKHTTYETTTCPKVFVYDLSKDLRDGPKSLDFERAFGPQAGRLYVTGQYQLGRIVEYRLMASKHCITTNPDEADLFYVPVFPNGRSVREWQRSCGKRATLVKKQLLKELVHLNNDTACKHFFIVSKSFEAATSCVYWWNKPISEFAPAMRVSYTELHYGLRGQRKVTKKFYKLRKDWMDYPNRISAPYPSSLHWRSDEGAPWSPEEEQPRDIFSLFVGRLNHGDNPVREEIYRQCNDIYKNDPTKCKLNLQTQKGKSKTEYIEKKLNTTFCLEPGGDTPDRKSISDSIASGCIPVLFNNVTGTGWGLFWGDWKAQAHVVVPREEWINREIDLYTLLHTTMPPQLLRIMQQTLRIYARQFQYSVDEDPNDGIRYLLEGMKRHSQQRMTDGKCNPIG